MSVFEELKRRNVVRIAVLYGVASWVILQVADVLFDALELPPAWVRLVLAVLILGFPVTLVVSWVYEMTPEGLKRETEIDRSQSITHVTSKRLDYIIIVLLVAAIGLLTIQYLRPPQRDAVTESVAELSATASAGIAPEPIPVRAAAMPDDKSIAVLPFSDMSEAKDQEYMSDGIAEELMNRLAQVSELRVIARTSSFAFKGKDAKVEQIAKELHVGYVVEGSVRKSGNKLRITVQLVRTVDSTHIWAETYNRPLDDIFAVQEEIAGAIVQALQIRLSGGELDRRKGGTRNLEAYQLYLQSVSAANQNTRSSLNAAAEYLEQAIKLDQAYGLAWSKLSYVVAIKTDNGYVAVTEGYERARALAQQALRLSPDLAEAHAQLMYIHLAFDWDWSAAKLEQQKALAIDPTEPWTLQTAGVLAIALGQWDEAERQLRLAQVRDPLNTYTIHTLGQTYYLAGRFEEAEGQFRKLLQLEPDFGWARRWLAKTLLAEGRPAAALAMQQQILDEGERLALLPVVLQAAGFNAEADEAQQAQIAKLADTDAYFVAMTYSYRGDRDHALEWLERAYKQKDIGLTVIVGEPLFDNLTADPSYIAFLRKMKLLE
jgi:TolB-like protein/Flp pilus assembly protein TadD